MTKRGKRKIGVNDPCPCGSGRKFKKCHGRPSMRARKPSKKQLDAVRAAHEARELLRESQQGKGKPIIAGKVADHQLVAVGNKIYYGCLQ